LEDTDIDSYSEVLVIAGNAFLQPIGFPVILGFLVMLVLILCSALVSGAEIAFFSLGPSQIKLLRTEKPKGSDLLLKLLEQPKRLLATVLIANNFVNVAIIVLSTYIIANLFDLEINPYLAFFIQVIIVTALLLILGEIMPKILAAFIPMKFALFMTMPFKYLISIFYPLSTVLVKSSGIIDRRISKKGAQLSMSDLSQAIDLTSDENTPDDERKILKGIIKFGDIEAKEIMKPRLDVTAVNVNERYHNLLKIILDAGYSRIPVYEESFDKIAGILYVKDLLPHLEKTDDFRWPELVRQAFFVPETKRINQLLQDFQKKKIHLAIVVDEYGGTSGIVTLEDIIEEIVGDISDEFDTKEDEVTFTKIDDHTYVFKGKTLLNDFCKIMDIEDEVFDDIKGDSDTLAGLIIELEGEIPKVNHSTKFQNFEFKSIKVDNRRILEIQVRVL
jgi:putative hemolysin